MKYTSTGMDNTTALLGMSKKLTDPVKTVKTIKRWANLDLTIIRKRYSVLGSHGNYGIYDTYQQQVLKYFWTGVEDNLSAPHIMACDKCRELNLEYDDDLLYIHEIGLYILNSSFFSN